MAVPKFTWDVAYLEKLAAELADAGDRQICLSPVSFRLVADMSAMLLWPTRFGLKSGDDVPELAEIAYQEINNRECESAASLDDFTVDEIEKYILESDRMSINIVNNVTCSSCGAPGGDTTLVCYSDDGEPIINYGPTVSDEDVLPPGGDWPMVPGVTPLPGDYETWEAFDAAACTWANQIWQIMIWILTATESAIDAIVGLAAALVALVAWLPAGLAAAIGVTGLSEAILAWIELLAFEEATDWILDIRQWVEDNQREVVCTLFSYRHDIPAGWLALNAKIVDYVHGIYGLAGDEDYALRRWLRKLIPIDFIWKMLTGATDYVVSVSEPYDCAYCGIPVPIAENYLLLPVPAELMTLTQDAHVTQSASGYTVDMVKPTLHYGDGNASFVTSELLAHYGLTNITPLGLAGMLTAASHYGYPTGTYGTVLRPVNTGAPGVTGLQARAGNDAIVKSIDGGSFWQEFDVYSATGANFDSPNIFTVEMLDHANQPYVGTASYRLYMLVRQD